MRPILNALFWAALILAIAYAARSGLLRGGSTQKLLVGFAIAGWILVNRWSHKRKGA